VTVNGSTVNTGGTYTVGNGFIGIGETTISSTHTDTDTQCKDSCVNSSTCDHWSRQVDNGTCVLRYNTDNASQTSHARGILRTAGNTGYIAAVEAGSSSSPQDCLDKCTSTTNCQGWNHRNNTHPETQFKNTCQTFVKSPSDTQYVEGFIIKKP